MARNRLSHLHGLATLHRKLGVRIDLYKLGRGNAVGDNLPSGGDYPDNLDRAEWAEHALSVFCEETGLDQEAERQSAVSDMLCNLGHYCDLHDLDFLTVASWAIGVWDAEKREEAAGAPNSLISDRKVYITVV